MCNARGGVRFAPNSDRESEFPANGHVRITPESGLTEKTAYREISFSHSSSVSTFTPCFLASASFEPAPGPATT